MTPNPADVTPNPADVTPNPADVPPNPADHASAARECHGQHFDDGQRLQAARIASQLSRARAARLADVDELSLKSWELGRTATPLDRLKRLARVYGTTVAALAGESTDQTADRPSAPRMPVKARQ